MAAKWTEPALKYGPTAEYGGCEAHDCRSAARVTCIKCQAHVCHGHAAHATHQRDKTD
jgi:hypothetical protein